MGEHSKMVRDGLTKEEALKDFLETKKKIQQDLINLSFEDKIKRVIEMQKIERDLKKDKGKKVYIWEL
jgi:hypothetical protein